MRKQGWKESGKRLKISAQKVDTKSAKSGWKWWRKRAANKEKSWLQKIGEIEQPNREKDGCKQKENEGSQQEESWLQKLKERGQRKGKKKSKKDVKQRGQREVKPREKVRKKEREARKVKEWRKGGTVESGKKKEKVDLVTKESFKFWLWRMRKSPF